jgi:23S rRNA pseudouridine2605 synthase
MAEAVGLQIRTLERVAFGPLRLGTLQPGEHRRLKAAEIDALRDSGRAPVRPPRRHDRPRRRS